MAKLVSNTYGEALFDLALEQKALDDIYAQVLCARECMLDNQELLTLLSHPKISREEKIEVVENIFKGRVSDTLVGLLVTVVEKGRDGDIVAIFDYFIDRYKEHRKIGVLYVTSAFPLSDAKKTDIESKIISVTDYKELETYYTVDESIIGGLILRIKDRVVDSSIKSKLEKMERTLNGVSVVTN